MPNILRRIIQSFSPSEHDAEIISGPLALKRSVSEDGTVVYRGLEVVSSSYEFDTLTHEQLKYWINRLPEVDSPFLVIVKPV